MVKLTKQGHFHIILQFTYDYMDYLMYLKTFLLLFDHFLDPGQKFVKFFDVFLENLKTSKRHSEINRPLEPNPDLVANGWQRSSDLGSIILSSEEPICLLNRYTFFRGVYEFFSRNNSSGNY